MKLSFFYWEKFLCVLVLKLTLLSEAFFLIVFAQLFFYFIFCFVFYLIIALIHPIIISRGVIVQILLNM